MTCWLPSKDDVASIHWELVEMFAVGTDPIDPPGIKNENLLESACFRPYTSLQGEEKYKTLEAKTAALFHSLVKNHAFHNGNKRTAFATLVITLCRNKRSFLNYVGDYELYQVVVKVAQNAFPRTGLAVDEVTLELSKWLRNNTTRIIDKPSKTKVSDFIQRCKEAGVRHEIRNGHHVLRNGPLGLKTTKISVEDRRIEGMVARDHWLKLGLRGEGYLLTNFDQSINREQDEIKRFVKVFQKLARS